MTPRFKFRASKLLLTVAAVIVCGLAMAPNAIAQPPLPKATRRVTETKSDTARRARHQARQTAPVVSKTPAAVESNHFLDLGDDFSEQRKWKAAEAAYSEAVKVWPGNADALRELGYFYVDRYKREEAQQVYSKLRSINGSYASDLLAEINRLKAAQDH